MKRFFFISGKGGVGKTTFAMSMVRTLREQKKKAIYVSFDSNQYNEEILEDLDIPCERITIFESSLNYIAKRIKSRVIARTIIKTPFYKAISNIVPGFNNIILLGRIRELMEDPELIVVLDAPATGHALTTIESLSTFKNIFNQGLVFKDIKKISDDLFQEDICKMIVVSTPEKLIDSESEEFISQLNEKGYQPKKVINKALSQSAEFLEKQEFPKVIQAKVEHELEFLQTEHNAIWECPFFFKTNMKEIVVLMTKQLTGNVFYE